MAAPTTRHLYERLYEVLCDGHGAVRTLPEGQRYARGYPPGFAASMRATRARERRGEERVVGAVFVVVSAASVERFASGEIGTAHLYRVRIALYRDHWLGFEGDPAEVEQALVDATDAFFRVRAALCWPGNLSATEAADDTGLAGGALNGAGASTRLVSVDSLGDSGRLLQFRDDFDAELDFDPDHDPGRP